MESVASLVLWLLVPTLAILVVLHTMDTWLRRRRAGKILAGRDRLSSAEFGQRYFRTSEDEARLAAGIRDALAQHLARGLDGLHPADLLWEDLHIDLGADPHFFWLLEEELEIHLIGKDAEMFFRVQRSVKTFRDLVGAVRQALSAAKAAVPRTGCGRTPLRAASNPRR